MLLAIILSAISCSQGKPASEKSDSMRFDSVTSGVGTSLPDMGKNRE